MDQIASHHEFILELISYIGSALSIVGLFVTVVLYSIFGNLRRDRGGKILLNLSLSLLLLNVAFLMGASLGNVNVVSNLSSSKTRLWIAGSDGVQSRNPYADWCARLAVLVHYLLLSSLCWMLVEAVHMYQLLITVFANSETSFMLKRTAAAWGQFSRSISNSYNLSLRLSMLSISI